MSPTPSAAGRGGLGDGKAKPVSLGGPIFSQQPEAGQHCGVDSALAGLGIMLTPRSLCEVLGLNPTIPSSIPLL